MMTIADMKELLRLLKLYIEEFGQDDPDYDSARAMVDALNSMLGGE